MEDHGMTQDTLAKISTYFRGIDEELLDNDALLRILDVIRPLWNDVPISHRRAVVTLAVAAGVFRYHEHDHLQPLDKLVAAGDAAGDHPGELPMSDARYWYDDYEDFLRGRGADQNNPFE
jgi:hypothetical protein